MEVKRKSDYLINGYNNLANHLLGSCNTSTLLLMFSFTRWQVTKCFGAQILTTIDHYSMTVLLGILNVLISLLLCTIQLHCEVDEKLPNSCHVILPLY